jgi:trimethylamine--corrinoid protein Co-methyltransferase
MRPSLQKIHDASMEILRTVGMRFQHPEALALLGDHGVRLQGDTAYFTENQVMDWVHKAPASFTLYARNPKNNIVIGGDRTHYAPAYGAVHIVQRNGNFRSPLLQDFVRFAKLIHQSRCFRVNGGLLVQPADVVPQQAPLILLYCAMRLSDKGLIGITAEPEYTKRLLELLAILVGGRRELIEKPWVIVPINTFSPLQVDHFSLDNLLQYVRHHQPTMISPCVMAGISGPVTLAGTIALANAEALAVIALTQMLNSGVPVLYGFQSTAADLRFGNIAIGCPERSLCISYGAKLARSYGLPSRGGGADNDAFEASEQIGYESMMAMMVTRFAKVNFVLHSAGMAASFAAMSYDQFVFGLEILGMIERYKRGVKVNPETLALDVIKRIGIGGHFIADPHTHKFCRKEFYIPEISHRGRADPTIDKNSLERKLQRKLEAMLANYDKPNLDQQTGSEMQSFLADHDIDTDTLEPLFD